MEERLLEKELLAHDYKKYRGKEVDVYFNLNICEHSGNCIRNNTQVFNVDRKPWILPDAGSVEEVTATVNTCPSGALIYIKKE